MTARSTGPRLVVTLTEGELSAIVRGAIEDALAEVQPARSPALVDRAGLARALHASVTTVGRLARRGMPAVLVGDVPRYEVAEVIAWLRSRRREAPKALLRSAADQQGEAAEGRRVDGR